MRRKILGRGEFGYISEGSDDGYTMRRNTTAFTDVQMLPRVLQGVEKPDQSTTFMGSKTGITAVNCADRREHAGTSKR